MSILVKLKIREDKSWFKKIRSENNSDGSEDRYIALILSVFRARSSLDMSGVGG